LAAAADTLVAAEGIGDTLMAAQNDKHKDYVRYAEHCLMAVPDASDQEYIAVQRDMAVEWLKLADAALHPLKRTT
jgi:hypothetical protein